MDDIDRATPQRKAALRQAALAARRQLTIDERTSGSAAVSARLLALPELREARTVALHAALADEVDLLELVAPLAARGVRTLFPRVRGEMLELAAIDDPGSLRAGYRGIREPVGPVIDPSVVEVVVLPGVAFDPHGNRLGQGGGHYDRLLARLSGETIRVGVCFACQLVPDVPLETHDVPVDVVVTERAVYRPQQEHRW